LFSHPQQDRGEFCGEFRFHLVGNSREPVEFAVWQPGEVVQVLAYEGSRVFRNGFLREPATDQEPGEFPLPTVVMDPPYGSILQLAGEPQPSAFIYLFGFWWGEDRWGEVRQSLQQVFS
jgi:hypothetical protein